MTCPLLGTLGSDVDSLGGGSESRSLDSPTSSPGGPILQPLAKLPSSFSNPFFDL